MSPGVKFLIGLVAVVVMGWTYHGPVGNGEALVNRLEAQAQAAVAASEIPGVQVRLGRDPLSRAATLSGPANDFQREGWEAIRASMSGSGRSRDFQHRMGKSAARQKRRELVMPLLLETIIVIVLAYLVGVGIAWIFFGRAKKDSYL
jgi:hypothetical protein